jgi:hypothetical protein
MFEISLKNLTWSYFKNLNMDINIIETIWQYTTMIESDLNMEAVLVDFTHL